MIASSQEIHYVEIGNYHMSRDGTTLLASITVTVIRLRSRVRNGSRTHPASWPINY